MIRIAICDDDSRILEEITCKIKKCFGEQEINAEYVCFSDPRELMDYLQKEYINVLFLDIDMPYFGGMDIAGFINEQDLKTILIFVTSHDSLVYQTFAYRPFGFIRKTHIDEELEELAARINKEIADRRQEIIIQKAGELSRIFIKDIMYIEAEGNYLNIYMQSDETVRIRETLGNIEKELNGKGFVRCHKGYLVNMDYMTKIKSSEIELRNKAVLKVIPIGRSYEKEVRHKILESIRG